MSQQPIAIAYLAEDKLYLKKDGQEPQLVESPFVQQILDLIDDNKRSTKEVEDIIVKEKQLCGRTSFYSYLRELKHKGKINYADVGDKTILVMVDKNN